MEKDTIILECQCPFCGKIHEVEVPLDNYLDYEDGELSIQEAFPNLSPNEREMIKTGICPTCWDKMMK